MPRQAHLLWTHFTKLAGKEEAKCNRCEKILGCKKASTQHLLLPMYNRIGGKLESITGTMFLKKTRKRKVLSHPPNLVRQHWAKNLIKDLYALISMMMMMMMNSWCLIHFIFLSFIFMLIWEINLAKCSNVIFNLLREILLVLVKISPS